MQPKKIKWELFTVILFISIIPIIIISSVSYNHYSQLIQKQVTSITEILISDSAQDINRMIEDMERVTLTFQESSAVYGSNGESVPDILKLFSYKEYNDFDLFQSRRIMKFRCDSLLSGYDYINGIYVFVPNGGCIRYTNGLDIAVDYNAKESEWYKETISANGSLYIGDVENKDYIIQASLEEPTIAFSRAIYDTATRELLGVVMIDCDLDIFHELDTEIIPNFTDISLVNETGKIIYNSDQSQIGMDLSNDIKQVFNESRESNSINYGDRILVVHRTNIGNKWSIIAEISLNSVISDFAPTQQLIIFVPILCVLIFIIISLFLSELLAKPIVELSHAMGKNPKGRNVVDNPKYLKRKDEVGQLYRQYNQMIIEINDYIKTRYKDKLITLDAQMRSLEAQINAHFLFNTLESINCIAEIEQVDSIARMAKALGDMFRYSIKTKSELVTVEAEITHVKNYLAIQQIRFDNSFDVAFNMEKGIEKQLVLKLILQPIVENCINHGITNLRKRGYICIKGYTFNNNIVFEVLDNGIGMTEQQLEELNHLLLEKPNFTELGKRTYASIGIKNINSRIQLYYSESYGLTVQSSPECGTKVIITVPIKIEE